MNENSKTITLNKRLTICKIVSAALTVAIAILAFLAFADAKAAEDKYFQDSPLTLILYIILGVSALFSIVAAFLFKKGPYSISYPKFTGYIAVLPALAVLIPAASTLASISQTKVNTMDAIILASSILSAVYFFSHLFNVGDAGKIITGYITIFLCMATIASFYVDFNVEMNAPIKIAVQLFAASTMICILADLKSAFIKTSIGQYVFSNIFNLFTFALTSVGIFVTVIGNTTTFNNDYVTYPIFFIAHTVFSGARFFTATIEDAPVLEESENSDDTEIQDNFSDESDAPTNSDIPEEDTQKESTTNNLESSNEGEADTSNSN